MKVKEAKAVLLNAAWLGTDEDRERTEEAIRVLSNQPNIEQIKAELAEDLEKYNDILDGVCEGLQMALDIISKYDKAESEPQKRSKECIKIEPSREELPKL